MKGFALGLALKQRRKATRKSPINMYDIGNPLIGKLEAILWFLDNTNVRSVTSPRNTVTLYLPRRLVDSSSKLATIVFPSVLTNHTQPGLL